MTVPGFAEQFAAVSCPADAELQAASERSVDYQVAAEALVATVDFELQVPVVVLDQLEENHSTFLQRNGIECFQPQKHHRCLVFRLLPVDRSQ